MFLIVFWEALGGQRIRLTRLGAMLGKNLRVTVFVQDLHLRVIVPYHTVEAIDGDRSLMK